MPNNTTIPEDDGVDHRRRTKAPEGIIPGSNEYWKWWRDNNRGRVRLYQRRAYLKRRKLVTAAARALENDTRIEDELREMEEQLASLNLIRDEPLAVVAGPPQHPFIADEAKRRGVTYEEALAIMGRDTYKESDWTTTMEDRLRDIIGDAPLGEEENLP